MTALVDLQRLARVCGLLGSDHDGEALAAARQAEKIWKKVGLTQGIRAWNLLDIPAGACAARARSILPSGVADTLRGRTAWIGSSPAGRVWKTRAPAMPGCTTSTNC